MCAGFLRHQGVSCFLFGVQGWGLGADLASGVLGIWFRVWGLRVGCLGVWGLHGLEFVCVCLCVPTSPSGAPNNATYRHIEAGILFRDVVQGFRVWRKRGRHFQAAGAQESLHPKS